MNATGIVRKLDELGRIVLPIETRRMLGIDIKDGLAVFVDGDRIILQKYAPGCTFCGEGLEDFTYFHGKSVCEKCRSELRAL